MDADERVAMLARALSDNEISPLYDESLLEVSQRIAANGSAGKADIGAIVFWKRIRANAAWVTTLLLTPDEDVRAKTGAAVEAVRSSDDVVTAARHGRSALISLPGFGHGDAIPSALLFAIDPSRLAVYDVRADAGLQIVDKPVPPGRRGVRDHYSRYICVLEELRGEGSDRGHAWSARDMDVALFLIGKPNR
jgi:hypothetical protein